MGARGKARREALGIPKNVFACTLDISSQRLSQIEAEGVSGIELASKWAKALDMSPQDLIFGTPETEPKKRKGK